MSRRYAVTTFGCQMNAHDSDRMAEVLSAEGWERVDDEESSDVVVLNTCSVREKAEQKLLSELGRLAKLKRRRPEMLVVVAGCVAQQEGERLLREARGVDLVLGPDNIPELPRLLTELEHGAPPLNRTVFDLDAPRFLSASPERAAVTAFVTTMKGCDERCSFCVVPYTRGPERYRPSEEIVGEIERLVAGGTREVTLLGQTVNSYRDPSRPPRADDDDASEFAALLHAIAERVPGLARLRYTSPHPRHLGPALVEAHATLPMLSPHVHLPVQSGSDRVLKRMIRRYTAADYRERVERLRARVPGLTLSTDIIVGFPGESESDFESTLQLVRDVGFVGVFGFKYSRRPYTPALKLDDDIPEAEKTARLTALFELSDALMKRHLDTLVGSEQRVLVEGPSKRAVTDDGPARPNDASAKTYVGRTERNEIVHLDDAAAPALVGEVVAVEIRRALKHSLIGALGPAALALASSKTPAAPAGSSFGRRPRRALPMVPNQEPTRS